MGDRTVIEKFHKKNEKRLFREKLIVLFWDFFLMFFFSFFFFITLYVLSCFLLCIWIGHFPMHSTRSWLREIISTMHKKSMKMAFILQRRPEVFGTCPLFFKNRYGLLSAAKSYGRQRIRKSGQKMKRPVSFRFDRVMIFFLSISLFSSNVDKLWTFFVCLKTERDHMFHMFRPGLAAKSLVIDAFVTIHLDL